MPPDDAPPPAITTPSTPAHTVALPPSPLSESQAAAVVNGHKPGFLTSEFWLHFVVMGALVGAGGKMLEFLPMLAQLPNLSPLASSVIGAAVPVATVGLGYLLKLAAADYQRARTALKLGGTPPANDSDAAGVVNKAGAVLLAVAMVFAGSSAWAQPSTAVVPPGTMSCAELLDAGVPAPAIKLPAGTVLEQPAWVVTPARMCAVGQALQICEAASAGKGSGVSPWVVVAVGAGAAAAGAAVTYGVVKASAK